MITPVSCSALFISPDGRLFIITNANTIESQFIPGVNNRSYGIPSGQFNPNDDDDYSDTIKRIVLELTPFSPSNLVPFYSVLTNGKTYSYWIGVVDSNQIYHSCGSCSKLDAKLQQKFINIGIESYESLSVEIQIVRDALVDYIKIQRSNGMLGSLK